ncbi:hypothetical protein L208DRAFT_1260168 [Tricholoma matsutake]|nr:hypothetical protein L208DRAFT_1260168 [Tricholoma matsutake 945]
MLNESSLITVLSMYSKTGGKNGKHAWVATTTHITLVSYIPMQVFEHMDSQQFHMVHRALQHLHLKRFTLLPSSAFLCTLNSTPQQISGDQHIELASTDYKCFTELCMKTQHIGMKGNWVGGG